MKNTGVVPKNQLSSLSFCFWGHSKVPLALNSTVHWAHNLIGISVQGLAGRWFHLEHKSEALWFSLQFLLTWNSAQISHGELLGIAVVHHVFGISTQCPFFGVCCSPSLPTHQVPRRASFVVPGQSWSESNLNTGPDLSLNWVVRIWAGQGQVGGLRWVHFVLIKVSC